MAVPPTNDSYVKIHAIRLPKAQLFCCTRSDVTRCFAPDALSWVGFGWSSKSFTFDSRSRHRPKIKGIVVAALTVSRAREAHLIFYPCDRSLYPSAATEQFGSQVLPRRGLAGEVDLRNGLHGEMFRPLRERNLFRAVSVIS